MKEAGKPIGSTVTGSVAGDIHEIGQTIVCEMLGAAGFGVADVDCDVPAEAFTEKVPQLQSDPPLLWALFANTIPNQEKTIEARRSPGLRAGAKEMIGGPPTTGAWADEIGADGYAEETIEAVAVGQCEHAWLCRSRGRTR